jgi:hypothetical protein
MDWLRLEFGISVLNAVVCCQRVIYLISNIFQGVYDNLIIKASHWKNVCHLLLLLPAKKFLNIKDYQVFFKLAPHLNKLHPIW